ncbi:putative signal transduction histidine kinase [Niastella koreensis GR20-10]|uniref:histidine kinase n=3 Tax=Niastella koreensis TaxID=354356 RepID=G8T8S3_NIAKG|nr:PAS domain S-box protein [Niastella koreensis]AEW01253.1 putative signal transduction histidine kinase [Niastella koreensis GR20-10]
MNPTFTTNYREMAPWLESILNDCQDAVFISDRHFNLVHWNVTAEELWFKQPDRPAKKNIVDFLNGMFPRHQEVHSQLQRAIALDEQVEDIFVATPDDRTYRISCYTHKFPGTHYLLDVVIIVRDLQATIHRKKEIRPGVLYKTLLNSLEEGVILLQGDQGTIISANNKACEIIGCTHEQLIGKNLTDIGGKAFREDGTSVSVQEYPGIITLRTGEVIKQQVLGFNNANGRLTWLSISTSLLEEFHESVPGLVAVTLNDVTACREAESRLSESEYMFQSFMNNTHSPAWIIDEDGYVIYMNDIFKRVWKLNDTHLYTNMRDLMPVDMVEQYKINNQRVLDSGQPLITLENSLRQDGTPGVYLVFKFLLQTSTPKRLIGGQSIDITEEKRAQEEILKVNERFYYTTKATSDYIWDWNIEKGTIYRSEPFSRLTGYTQNDMENDLYWLLEKIHIDDRQRVMSHINACLMSRNNYWHDEYQFRCADGSYKYLADKGYIIYKDGIAVRAIGAIQDLTEKRKLEAELEQQKEKERLRINQAMIAGQEYERNEISKELHDNVNQILSSAMILLSTAKGSGDEQENLLDKTSQYINLAIQEIRKISKSLNSSIIKEVGFIDPVEDIIKNMQLVRPVVVDFECDPELEIELTNDVQLMLYRIIQEQTNNIMRYAEAGYVRIAIEKSDDALSLVILDNGKGFDPDQQTRGIGLLNIRNRAETFGGTLTIDTKPMAGCRLEVQIPL